MAERDAVSLGAAKPTLSSDLIMQIPPGAPAIEMTYQEAIREALREEMARDPAVFVMGEDIGKHGGAFGVTRTLFDQFGPMRVINTPISENTIVGAGTGAALVGMRPVMEIMFVDFSGLAMDQICTQAAKLRLMTGGQAKVPWVLRMPQGGGAGKSIAAQHSQSLEVWFAHIPGLKVVLPSTPYDAKGLLKGAIRDDNPVIFLEQKFLYAFKGLVPTDDYTLPLGQCDVKREGKDVTVVASGLMVWYAMLAARLLAPEGIEVEVIDVRTISPLDRETIGRSARKTGRVVVIAEACKSYGPTGEWAMTAVEEAFDYLRAPIVRVTGRDTPIPFADSIEKGAWPETDDVVNAIRNVMAWQEEQCDMAVEFYVHKMSEHMETAEIIEWLVKEGDTVAEHQPIVEVMTDKFTVELEAPAAGVLRGIRPGCAKGAIVPVGEPIAFIARPDEKIPSLPPFGGGPVTAASMGIGVQTDRAPSEAVGRVKSTPVARRMAKDLGIDIEQIDGSGPGGRVSEADVRAAAEVLNVKVVATVPSHPLPLAPSGAVTWQELTPVQRITGERMHESIVNAPQFALELRADATNLLWLREALNDRITLEARVRLSLTGLLVKIVAATLPRHARANAELADGKIKLHGEINVGVAVGTAQGLVVPVVRHAGRKSLAEVMAELAAFQQKAENMRFSAEDLAGGTFTISNLGMFGVERFNAILNPPQSAILAIGAVVKTPVALPNDTVGVRPMMSLTLTVDHRVLDGLLAAKFLTEIKEKIEKPYFLI